MRLTTASIVAGLVALSLAGCNRVAGDSVDDEALQAIGDAVAVSLNEPGAAIVQLLKSVNRPSPIAAETLQITLDQKPVPLDWWLVGKGLVQPISPPPAPDRMTFLIAPTAEALIAQGGTWFTAGAGTPSHVDCHSPDATALGGCVVDVEVTPSTTEAGAAFAGSNALPTIRVHAIVASLGEGWQVREIRTEGGSLQEFALKALIGDEQARAAARQQMFGGVAIAGALTAPPASDLSGLGGGPSLSPLPPPIDTAPVAPVIGDSAYAPKRGL